MKKYVAEFIGTFWLVLGGCSSAVLAEDFPDVGDWAVSQLWLFWVAPIVGGVLGAIIYRFTGGEQAELTE